MKHSVELSEAEIAKAIKDYMNSKLHKYAGFDVRFNVAKLADPFDRPIGRYLISAIVTQENYENSDNKKDQC